MWKIPNTTQGARLAGYIQEMEDLRDYLIKEHDTANEVFMLFRQGDSNYQDPRTDYTLGRRDAIDALMSVVSEKLRNKIE